MSSECLHYQETIQGIEFTFVIIQSHLCWNLTIPLLQSFWVWQGFMDRIAFFYYSIKYSWAYSEEGKEYEIGRENLRNYGGQALACSDIGAEQGGKSDLFLNTNHFNWSAYSKETGRSATVIIRLLSHPHCSASIPSARYGILYA